LKLRHESASAHPGLPGGHFVPEIVAESGRQSERIQAAGTNWRRWRPVLVGLEVSTWSQLRDLHADQLGVRHIHTDITVHHSLRSSHSLLERSGTSKQLPQEARNRRGNRVRRRGQRRFHHTIYRRTVRKLQFKYPFETILTQIL
jgi:hypothetical protein